VRTPGLSAMLRVRNEAEWLAASLESIIEWCDEVVICVQPSDDNTLDIADAYAYRYRHVSVYQYPFCSWPNGPGYREQNPNHPESRTYFYNWALEKTTRLHVLKWDGDMVAQDWLGDRLRKAVFNDGKHFVRLEGINIAQVYPRMLISSQPVCPFEGLFLVRDSTRFVNGQCSERLIGVDAGDVISKAFLHFKWCKASARQAWPENWHEIEHFKKIDKRARATDPYLGDIPSAMAWASCAEQAP